ncbi:hypothetical protein LGL55_12645 [Clostridium tagluense]|nr:hypothetical protein [Clostridium tagluense]MCB2312184.1 hypothetical protein [Clostridium tagluense]MCB2316771.1 hypothetical protein [Clostridium tagluense]MCB2321631.1 hypothetical protein [Clostridium tagluense]MCB2326640.1 hypothetical protein [Clostridium tagluense]MCB2331363.1 hypothetical protein [Clostridium tagluense]
MCLIIDLLPCEIRNCSGNAMYESIDQTSLQIERFNCHVMNYVIICE